MLGSERNGLMSSMSSTPRQGRGGGKGKLGIRKCCISLRTMQKEQQQQHIAFLMPQVPRARLPALSGGRGRCYSLWIPPLNIGPAIRWEWSAKQHAETDTLSWLTIVEQAGKHMVNTTTTTTNLLRTDTSTPDEGRRAAFQTPLLLTDGSPSLQEQGPWGIHGSILNPRSTP
ncbi:hypothetical protein CKAH01_05171 [Colletotrichum kahawae]|uniref:Uncharacterized protein n=1 Tax=Colletotrichum kahawae TaxID=34407 RepID=A0AAE0D5T1_COLKA|nr:hypothetical protein CKAH01_05171 [Colletotrichum kahawae]